MERAVVAHAEAAVLRHAALGDVELAHDLDARDDGGVVFLGDGLHGLLQHAVDAVLDDHRVVARFDVNIAGAPLQRGEDRGIDQADDGADVGLAGQLLDRDGLVGVLVFAMTSSAKSSLASSSTRCDCSVFFRMSLICERRGDLGGDAAAQQQADLVDHHQLAGIGDGDQQASVVLLFQRHEVVAEHQVHWDLAEQLVLDVEVLQVHELAAIAPRQVLAMFDFVAGGQAAVAAYENRFWYFCHENLPVALQLAASN